VVDGPVTERAGLSFGGLLRRLRDEAGLTQDELAEAARVSQRAVSDLERGINRTARKDTAVLLAGALGLDGPARELFISAARGRRPAAGVLAAAADATGTAGSAAASKTLPRDLASFTGRQDELAQLGQCRAAAGGGGVVSVYAIGGMAGIGKTTLAVHAAHQLAGRFPDGQIFLPLHAHTPGQRPVDPADALGSLLLTAGVAARAIPPGLDARARCWRDYLAGKKILLVLDDAAGHEQVRPLLPGTAGSLVLITSRRRLAALEDAAVIGLQTMAPDEAAELLARLAGRPDLAAGDPGLGGIARLCGYLPLAIGMLASQLRHHPAWTVAGLAGELAAAYDRLELMAAEDLSVAAAFDLSYRDLSERQRRMFRRLGLHPGPDIDAYAAAALAGSGLPSARRLLAALYDQHLITEPAPGRYRLHDLVREHARALAVTDDPAESDAATGRLLDYYLHTALAAGRHFPGWVAAEGPAPPGRPAACAPPVSTFRQAAAWLEDERANLDAAARHAAACGRPRYAMLIPDAMNGFLDIRGYYDQGLSLQQMALGAAAQAGDQPGQARSLLLLANMHDVTGDKRACAATMARALALYRDLGDRDGQGYALFGQGYCHTLAGDYQAAAACHRQALDLFRGTGHRRGEADALNWLGEAQQRTGDYRAAAASHQQALHLYCDLGDRRREGEALIGLGRVQRLTGDYPAAATTLHQAMALHRDLGDRYKQACIINELGALQRLAGDYRAAAASHQQALDLFRDLGDPEGQAAALNELGLVQQLTGDYRAAAASHQQALDLFRDLGERRGQAESLNSLGELSARTAARQQSRDHHAQALAIARQIGAPLEEARALEGTGHTHLQDGHAREGTACLEQALAIYQRIEAPDARRIQQTLADHRTKQPNPGPETVTTARNDNA